MPEIVEEVQVELSEPQAAVMDSRKNVTLNMAGQGGAKSFTIGLLTGMFAGEFPKVKQFIGANTNDQLSHSTTARVFEVWKNVYGFTEWEKKSNPSGAFVIDKKPPLHFQRLFRLKDYHNTISFWNGALIFTGSLENFTAHEGKEFAAAHLDETKDTKEEAIKTVILGRLRQYGLWFDETKAIHFDEKISPEQAAAQGWKAWTPLYIHTSPAVGGVPWLYKMFNLEKVAPKIKAAVQRKARDFFYMEFENKAVCIYSAYHNEHNLRPGFLKDQETNLIDEDKILMLVHGYPFGKSGGEYYPSFRRDQHVGRAPYIPGLPVSTAWDFNVVPYMTCLCIQIEELLRYIDPLGIKWDVSGPDRTVIEVSRIRVYREYCFGSPRNSVAAIGLQFAADHDPANTSADYYGDAMGLRRVEGLGSQTRFSWVEEALFQFFHNNSKKVKDPNVIPIKRRDFLDAIFRGAYPNIEIIIDETCEKTINDFENLKEGPAGKIKKKAKDPITKKDYEEVGHTSDALECMVSEAFKYLLNTN